MFLDDSYVARSAVYFDARTHDFGFWVCLQPVAVRGLQTSADSTTLTEDASHSQPFTVKLHEDSFRSIRTDTPGLEVEVSKDELLGMYKTMNVMRRMEMAADALYKQKLIRGFCHLAIGQVSSGLMSLRAISAILLTLNAYLLRVSCHRKQSQSVWRLESHPKTG